MTKAKPDFVRQELGNLNDLEVAQVVALSASEAEVVQARAWLDDDETVLQSLSGPSPRVQQILDIAQAAEEDDDDDGRNRP